VSEMPAAHAAARELPPLVELTQLQQRGVDCVFCGITLVPGDVTDLGDQLADVFGTAVTWFPRAHPRCLGGVS